jgi:hypothetical protein
MDQNRHSGRSGAQTRNSYPIERDWIPAVVGMMIWLGMLCQQPADVYARVAHGSERLPVCQKGNCAMRGVITTDDD